MKIHAAGPSTIESVRVPEREPDVVQDHERLRAGPVLVLIGRRETHKPLLLGLAVGMLEDDSEQSQRIDVCARRADGAFIPVIVWCAWRDSRLS